MIFRVLLILILPVLAMSQDTLKTKKKWPSFESLTLVDKEDSAKAQRKAYFKNHKLYKLPIEMKRNFFYVKPVSTLGEGLLNLGIWIGTGLGYDRLFIRTIKNPYVIGFRVGILAISSSNENSKGDLFLTKIPHSKSSIGISFNIEHKLLMKKKFYYSTNYFIQKTTTQRLGEYVEDIKISDNAYKVHRFVGVIMPKLGLLFVNNYGLYTDIGFGAGLRYIYSFSVNKINKEANKDIDEYPNFFTLTFADKFTGASKLFDEGGRVTPKLSFQLKLGYNF